MRALVLAWDFLCRSNASGAVGRSRFRMVYVRERKPSKYLHLFIYRFGLLQLLQLQNISGRVARKKVTKIAMDFFDLSTCPPVDGSGHEQISYCFDARDNEILVFPDDPETVSYSRSTFSVFSPFLWNYRSPCRILRCLTTNFLEHNRELIRLRLSLHLP